jgi:hypothetical protein
LELVVTAKLANHSAFVEVEIPRESKFSRTG